MNIQTHTFYSHGSKCEADLITPDGAGPFPCVLMGHGFAAQRDFGLEPFARNLVEAGAAVFRFDHRGFARSEGLPRQWVSPRRHLQDWHCALSHVRQLAQVDSRRIGLWGTSFSGGHVLVVAAQDRRVRAVSSQVPFVSGVSALRNMSLGQILRLSLAGLRDLFQSISGGPAYRLPVIGKPGEAALLNTAECEPGFWALVPEDSAWENATPARIALTVAMYSPMRFAGDIACPVLMVAGSQDSLIPLRAVQRTADKIPDCRLEILECNHFAPYQGEWLRDTLDLQRNFFHTELGLDGNPATRPGERPSPDRAGTRANGSRTRSGPS